MCSLLPQLGRKNKGKKEASQDFSCNHFQRGYLMTKKRTKQELELLCQSHNKTSSSFSQILFYTYAPPLPQPSFYQSEPEIGRLVSPSLPSSLNYHTGDKESRQPAPFQMNSLHIFTSHGSKQDDL